MTAMLEVIREGLKDNVANWEERRGRRVYCDVSRNKIAEVARALVETYRLRFITASGTDTRFAVEILYHFSVDEEGAVLSLRVALAKNAAVSSPNDQLEVDSLAPFLKAAEWIEREMREMLGVNFRGHPDPQRLLLSDDWPAGSYPLRREGEVQT